MLSKPIVIIINMDYKNYYSHRIFNSSSEAFSFAEGMEEAWKISHGHYNCWKPLVLCCRFDYEEWHDLGYPGKEIILKFLD